MRTLLSVDTKFSKLYLKLMICPIFTKNCIYIVPANIKFINISLIEH